MASLCDPVPVGSSWPADTPLLAPVEPGAVIGVSHPVDRDGAHRVQGWLKATGGVVGPGGGIERAPWASTVVAEGELAVVIGTEARALTAGTALGHVLGYTVANDVTNAAPARDAVFFAAKSGAGYTPLGPWIETEVGDPDALDVHVAVDGGTVRRSSTAALPNRIADVLVALTATMTLRPGDVVLTGCPGTDAPLHAGARVRVGIAGIGILENPVA